MRSGSQIEFRLLAGHHARIAWLRGDLAAAVEDARFVLDETKERGFQIALPFATGSLVAALLEQGEFEEAENVLVRRGVADGITFAWWMLVPARIKLALARGDICRARHQLSAVPERAALTVEMASSEVAVALASGSTDEAQERAQGMVVVASASVRQQRWVSPGDGLAWRRAVPWTGGVRFVVAGHVLAEHEREAIDEILHCGSRDPDTRACRPLSCR